MYVARFIVSLDFVAIRQALFLSLRLFGICSLLPLLVSAAAGEFRYSAIFAGLSLLPYGVGRILGKPQLPIMGVKEGLVATALIYLVFSVLGSLAFLPEGPFVDCLFDAVSGYTTTGLSLISAEVLPKSLLFFRAYCQWIGGAGIVVLSLVTLVGPGRNAFRLYASEFGEENLVGNVRATARIVLRVYLIMTGAGFLMFLLAGMGGFDALLHIMAAVSTGGFAAYGDSIGHYERPVIQGMVILFMMLGAVGFPAYYLLQGKRWRDFFKDIQIRCLVLFVFAAGFLYWGLAGWGMETLLPSAFRAATAVSTTGFSVSDGAAASDAHKLLTTVLMLVGGSAGSTAGGLKIFRFIVLFKLVQLMVVRPLLPGEAKISLKAAGRVISRGEIEGMFGFWGLYMALFFLTAAALAFYGNTAADALFEGASALGTVGLSTGIVSPELPSWIKLLLAFDMWAGRLEILPVLVMFYPTIWKKRSFS